MTFAGRVETDNKLEVYSELELAKFDEEWVIASHTFSPITIFVSAAPVVFLPRLDVVVGADGSINVGWSTSVTQELKLRAGVEYIGSSGWHPIGEFSSEFTNEEPQATLEATLKGYYGLRLNVYMYGIAGPYIKVTPYLELEVTPLDDPWLTLSAGVDVPAGFSVVEGFKRLGDRFMLELEDFECISVQTKTVLLERVKQNNPPYEPHSPTPANGMTLDTINPILSWTSGDPDGDAVVYDVWFETGDSSPDILVSENQPETYYDPGNLQPNTTYYWQVTAKDTDRRNSYSPIWSFTTGENLVIPGGMVIIPAGTFLMGCDPDHNVGFDCMPDQIPLHEVYLDAYQIDKYEVTNIQYAQCVAAGSCDPPETNVSSTRSSYYDNPTYANYPVIAVFWDNADDYCTWAGKRLPTEAEWEKAARGTTLQIYPWGDSGPTCSLANYEHNTGNCVGDTSEVGSYPTGASPYGVMDMAGNVWEYVADWYGYDYYSVSPGMNPAGPFSGSYKVRRGGDWQNLDYHLLVANRSIAWEDFPDLNSGFRCAAPLE